MSEGGPSHWRLYSLISLMTVLWSGNFVVAKLALREMPAMLMLGMRLIIAALCILPVYRRRARNFDRRDFPRMLVLGALGVGLNQVFFITGMARTSVGHAAIIIALTPIVVLLLARLFGQERLRLQQMAGMVIALAGVGVLQTGSGPSKAHSLLGDLLILAGCCTFSFYTVAGKHVTQRAGAVAINTIGYTASAILLLPLTVSLGLDFDFARVTWVGWSSLLYMAAFASVLCYLIYSYALSHAPASRVAAFSYLQPVIATVMAIPALGEYPTRSLFIGGALVFAGVLLAERS